MEQKLLEDLSEMCSLSSLPLGQSDVLLQNSNLKTLKMPHWHLFDPAVMLLLLLNSD